MSSLPSEWLVTTIGQINTYSGNTVDPLKTPEKVFELYSVPAYPTRQPEIVIGSKIGSLKQIIEPDDVLLCKINPRINRVWKTGPKNIHPQIGSSEWIVIRQPLINPDFLRHQLSENSFRKTLCAEVSGVGGSLTRAQPKKVSNYSIALPPLAEQNRIARILNDLLIQVDALNTRFEAITSLLKRFRQSVLAAAISGQLTTNSESSAPPTHWKRVPFSTVIDDLRYGTAQKCEYNGGAIGVLRIPNITENGITLDDIKSSNFSDTEVAKLCLREGDILLIRSNGSIDLVGRSAAVSAKEEGLLFAGYLIRVRLDREKAHPAYVNFWLKSPLTRQAIELAARSTNGVNNINSEEIRSLIFTAPPLSEQIEISRRVTQLFELSDQLDAKIAIAQARVRHLTQSILAKAMSGELTADWRAANQSLVSGENSAASLMNKIQLERQKEAEKVKPKRPGLKKAAEIAMSHKIIKVLDALRNAGQPLTGQQLLAAAGYPPDSSTDLLEQFFLDIRETLSQKQITRQLRDKDGQDWFALVIAQEHG